MSLRSLYIQANHHTLISAAILLVFRYCCTTAIPWSSTRATVSSPLPCSGPGCCLWGRGVVKTCY